MSDRSSSGARSPESFEREIASLSRALHDECANSLRLSQEALGGSVFDSAQRILADDGEWTKGDAKMCARFAVGAIEDFRRRIAEAREALNEGEEAVVRYLRGDS